MEFEVEKVLWGNVREYLKKIKSDFVAVEGGHA